MIPDFDQDGNLPPGVHWATWEEICDRFGKNSNRQYLLGGLMAAITSLKKAGCRVVYIDGSFVTDRKVPNDFDACWDPAGVNPTLLDPVLLTFDHGRAAQKTKYLGELFPSITRSGNPGPIFLEFFQTDKNTGKRKGIIAIDLKGFK